MIPGLLNFVVGKKKDFLSVPYMRRVQANFTDIHCHCLPYIDDGPLTMGESLKLCEALTNEGVKSVVATPHQLGRFEGRNEATQVRKVVDDLNQSLKANEIPLKVLPGGEIRVDERICRLIENDEVMTLADSKKFILLELPFQTFINIELLLKELNSMGIRSIISHVEKIEPLVAQPDILYKWFEHSVYLQVTASSLLGDFGLKIQRAAWNFLSSRWVSFIATDSHDVNHRRPRIREAFDIIRMKLGESIARLVCIENPARVITGQNIVSV